ncbi:hypothetical protein MNEG_7287, partial [Monoraphidium neglectum]
VITAPGPYQLRFMPLVLQHLQLAPGLLNLNLRHCEAGESNATTALISAAGGGSGASASAAAAGVLAPCQRCRLGSVSLDPNAAGGCNLCDDADHALW